MHPRHICILVFGVIASLLTVERARGEDSSPPNVILIGWDGAQRNHVRECLARDELPNLAKLGSEGALVEIDILRKTDTKAGWSQILTGYNPEVTGVFSNGEYRPIPPGYTVFERLEEAFGAQGFITAAIIGKSANVGNAAPRRIRVGEETVSKKLKKRRIVKKKGVEVVVVPGQPFFNASRNMDVFVNGLKYDDKVGKTALKMLERYRDQPFFFFVHFAEVDTMGHRKGENSKEYNDALRSGDEWLGRIREKLEELGLEQQTTIYVTADHGFDEGRKKHKDAPYVFLATNDPGVVRRGERADIAPTVLRRFGIDLGGIEPRLDGRSLTEQAVEERGF